MSGRHSADDWQRDELPVLIYRHWLPGDPEWTFPRHANKEPLMLTSGHAA